MMKINENISDAFRALLEKTSNIDVVLADIGEYLLLAHEERFAQQIAPDGTPWTTLDPDYTASKRKRNSRGQGKILVLDGYLRSTLRYQVSNNELTFGTDRPYGAAMQFGVPEKNIPARPFLGISGEDEVEITAILNDWLLGE